MIGVGMIGTGAIGRVVASRLAAGEIPGAELAAIAGRAHSETRLRTLAQQWNCRSTVEPLSLPSLGAALIVEAAGIEAAREYAVPLLELGGDLVMMSVGALAEPAFASRLWEVATACGRKVYLPSGAIAGIDGILAAREDGVSAVQITTRKHPSSLVGAPFLANSTVELGELAEPLVLFEGSARDAIAGFPSNINVALTLAMAVGSLDKVTVQVIADPAAEYTVHKIEVAANSGTIAIEVRNLPLPENARSSLLAALSALATIRKAVAPLWMG